MKTTRKRRIRSRRMRGGQLHIPICIYSHSETFDVLEIQIYYLNKLFKGTAQKIYIFTNVPYTKPTELKYEQVLYDDKLHYNRRLVSCIEKVKEPIFILSHESDVLLQYDKNLIQKIVDKMKEHKVDSVELIHMPANNDKEIPITDGLYMFGKEKHDFTFNVQPRIWNRESAIEIFSKPQPKTYVGSENQEVQNFVRGNQKTCMLHSTTPVKSNQFTVTKAYVTLHLTKTGKFKELAQGDEDPMIKKEHAYMYETWIKSSSRGK
jgi:hypothetical protein